MDVIKKYYVDGLIFVFDNGYWILRTFNGGIYLDNYFRYRGEPAEGGSFYPGFDKIRFKSP